jgi:hypothetical protein
MDEFRLNVSLNSSIEMRNFLSPLFFSSQCIMLATLYLSSSLLDYNTTPTVLHLLKSILPLTMFFISNQNTLINFRPVFLSRRIEHNHVFWFGYFSKKQKVQPNLHNRLTRRFFPCFIWFSHEFSVFYLILWQYGFVTN